MHLKKKTYFSRYSVQWPRLIPLADSLISSNFDKGSCQLITSTHCCCQEFQWSVKVKNQRRHQHRSLKLLESFSGFNFIIIISRQNWSKSLREKVINHRNSNVDWLKVTRAETIRWNIYNNTLSDTSVHSVRKALTGTMKETKKRKDRFIKCLRSAPGWFWQIIYFMNINNNVHG